MAVGSLLLPRADFPSFVGMSGTGWSCLPFSERHDDACASPSRAPARDAPDWLQWPSTIYSASRSSIFFVALPGQLRGAGAMASSSWDGHRLQSRFWFLRGVAQSASPPEEIACYIHSTFRQVDQRLMLNGCSRVVWLPVLGSSAVGSLKGQVRGKLILAGPNLCCGKSLWLLLLS